MVGSNSLLGWYLVSGKTVKKQLLQEGLLVPEEGDLAKEEQVGLR